jgi:hypothetical protein
MTASTHSRNLFATGLIVLFAWPACGGSTAEPKSADQADETEPTSSGERDDDSAPSESGGDARTVASKPACDDGTCTLCGDAQCPIGWYCDESAKGGPACGWLPECAKKPTCACVKKAFSGCSCEERDGSPHVTCS